MKVREPNLLEPTEEDLRKVYAGAAEKPKKKPAPEADEFWMPGLMPLQMEAFMDTSKYLLIEGPRYTGKGHTSGYKIVRHCWDHYNAFALIVVKRKSQGVVGGIWHKLETEVIPDFQKNVEGFEFKGPIITIEKHPLIWIKNRFGGWSAIQLMSLPNGVNLQEITKGMEVSLVYVDELTEFEHDTYFTKLITLLGRRNHIAAKDQVYIATANPHGPSHWVYKRFHEMPFRNGGHDKDYRFIFLPISENPDPKAQAYLKVIIDGAADDPVLYQRDVVGEWVDRPSGVSLFGAHFVPKVHTRGDLVTGEILHPKSGLVSDIGYDLGDVNSCMVFLQQRHTSDKTLWICYDEIAYHDQKISYDDLVPELLERMNYWCEEEQHDFTWEHISDKSAFDRFRAATGSYDARQIEQISRSHLLTVAGKQLTRLKRPIKLLECPKPSGSVAGRIKLLRGLLSREEIYISARCKAVIAMLGKLESEKDEPFVPKRNQHLHVFDALTYPLFYHNMGGAVIASGTTSGIQPEIRHFA